MNNEPKERTNMKEKQDTRGTARCADCLFGRPVTVVDRDRKAQRRRGAKPEGAAQ